MATFGRSRLLIAERWKEVVEMGKGKARHEPHVARLVNDDSILYIDGLLGKKAKHFRYPEAHGKGGANKYFETCELEMNA